MPSNDNSFDWAAYNKRINEKNSHYDYTYVTGRKYETSYKSYLMDNSKKTIPNVAVSPVTHLIQGFNFIVRLNNFTFGFKDVSGLSLSDRAEYIEEGGVNDHQILVRKPNDDTPTLTFSRGLMIRCNPILNMAARAAAARIPDNLARQAALIAANTMDPQATLETGPAIGMIEVYDRAKKLCAMYSFLSLGMTEWSVDNLNANDSDILVESITIAHTGLVRIPLGAPNTHLGYIKSGDADQDYQDYLDAMSLREKAEADKRKALEDAREAALTKQEEALKKKADELKTLKEELKKKIAKRQAELDEERKNIEAAKEEAAKENAEKEAKAKEDAKAAKEKAAADRKEQIEARQKEIDAQKADLDKAAEGRSDYDKQFEGAEDKRKEALDAQKSALEESAAARDEYGKQFEGAEDKRKEALDAQKSALEESAAARDEYDKQFEGAEDSRQAAKDAQKSALEESAAARDEYDKQFEGAEDSRQAAKDAQKEALKKSAEERKESDKKAKEDAEKAQAAAKEKAEQTEAKKKGGT